MQKFQTGVLVMTPSVSEKKFRLIAVMITFIIFMLKFGFELKPQYGHIRSRSVIGTTS